MAKDLYGKEEVVLYAVVKLRVKFGRVQARGELNDEELAAQLGQECYYDVAFKDEITIEVGDEFRNMAVEIFDTEMMGITPVKPTEV